MTRQGPVNFIAILTNDCYKGLDQFKKCQIVVQDIKADAQDYVQEDIETIKMISPVKPEDFRDDESDSDTEAPYNQKGNEDAIEENHEELIRRFVRLGLKNAADELILEDSDNEKPDAKPEQADPGSPEKPRKMVQEMT